MCSCELVTVNLNRSESAWLCICCTNCCTAWGQVGSRWMVGFQLLKSSEVKEAGVGVKFIVMIYRIYAEQEEPQAQGEDKIDSSKRLAQCFGRAENFWRGTQGRWAGRERCGFQGESFLKIPEMLLNWEEVIGHWKLRSEGFESSRCWTSCLWGCLSGWEWWQEWWEWRMCSVHKFISEWEGVRWSLPMTTAKRSRRSRWCLNVRWWGAGHLEHQIQLDGHEINVSWLLMLFHLWILWHSVGRAVNTEFKREKHPTLFTFWTTLHVNYITICLTHPLGNGKHLENKEIKIR